CVIKSMYADIPNHEPTLTMLNTGANLIGRPSMGSWITYGLGTMNENLPGYVVLTPTEPLTIGSPLWTSSFLPAVHEGMLVNNKGVEEENFKADGVIRTISRGAADDPQLRDIGFLRQLNQIHMERI